MEYPSLILSLLLPEMQLNWPLLEEMRVNVQPQNLEELAVTLWCSVTREDLGDCSPCCT